MSFLYYFYCYYFFIIVLDLIRDNIIRNKLNFALLLLLLLFDFENKQKYI
jgi:hypothetical protein